MEPKEKRDYLVNLMPFVILKVNNIHPLPGEVDDWGQVIE